MPSGVRTGEHKAIVCWLTMLKLNEKLETEYPVDKLNHVIAGWAKNVRRCFPDTHLVHRGKKFKVEFTGTKLNPLTVHVTRVQ